MKPLTAASNSVALVEPQIDENAIAVLATDRLQRDGSLAMWHLSCVVREGTLTLHGVLPTYYLKQLAQTVVLGIEGVDQIVNYIEVIGPASRKTADRHRRNGFDGGTLLDLPR